MNENRDHAIEHPVGLLQRLAARPRTFRSTALVVASAMFMQQLDSTVLTVALPTMARDLGVAAPTLSLALTSYLVALALFIPASGTLADRFGSRIVFCLSIAIFLIGSIACAMAFNLPSLVAARFLQGIGGAMMVPVGRLVVLRSVDRTEIIQALSWLVMPALIGPILGPPLGGMIVTWLEWRWIFYINLPIGLAGIVFALILVPNVHGVRTRFDWIGFVLSGAAFACILFGLELASRSGTGSVALALLAGGSLLAAAYLVHARHTDSPILDPALLRTKNFRLSVIAGSLARITQGAQPFLLPLMFQLGFGYSAAVTGTLTVSVAIGGLAMKVLAPRILRRWGFRRSLIVSGLVGTAGYALCSAFRPDWPIPLIIGVLLAAGFFTSFQFTAYNAIAYADIDDKRMSSATSFYATFQQLSMSVGICLAATTLELAPRVAGRTTLSLEDFSMAFLIVACISGCAIIWNRGFTAEAGQELSGEPSANSSSYEEIGVMKNSVQTRR